MKPLKRLDETEPKGSVFFCFKHRVNGFVREHHHTLIPVLVTGIQPMRVCAAKESLQPKDLG
ncbi:hypothetical protein [Rhizobium sp.]|uniref:hypothetical protein n=1 Tax=Rhizobium sp. TaxID=391 RepID=UPI0028B15B95